MLDELLALIDSHRSTHHDVFDKLAERKLRPAVLAGYLREMGAFCAASRPGGYLAVAFQVGGYSAQARLLEEIFESEADHGEARAEMARLLLGDADEARADWCNLPADGASQAVQEAARVFRARNIDRLEDIYYSLGALLALEKAAHGKIIPGEVEAFTARGHYGLTLAQVRYLAEHYGELGAERMHEDHIMTLFKSLTLNADQWSYARRGALEMLEALAGLYDELAHVISA